MRLPEPFDWIAMPELQKTPRSRIEWFVALSSVIISIALLVWVGVDLAKTVNSKPLEPSSSSVYELADRAEPIIRNTTSNSNSDMQDLDSSPNVTGLIEPSIAPDMPTPVNATKELQNELEVARKDLDMFRVENNGLRASVVDLGKQLAEESENAKIDLAKSQQMIADLQAENSALKGEIARVSKQLSDARRVTSSLRGQIAEQAEEATEAEQELDQLQFSRADAQAAYQAKQYQNAATIWGELASAGDPKAQFHLGSLLFEGRLGSPNLLAAHRYLTQSIAGGFGPALAMRNRVRQAMTPEQLSAINGS